jgi:hypothetical protein
MLSGAETPTTERGGSQAFNVMPPFLAINFYIKVK